MKKTVVISVFVHITLFSAALLFSAGLLKGSGDFSDSKVFFVSLEAEMNKVVDGTAFAVKAVTLQKRKIVEQEVSPPVIAKKKEDAVETVVAEKAEEAAEDILPEKSVTVVEESDTAEVINDNTILPAAEGLVSNEEIEEYGVINENEEGIQLASLSDEATVVSGGHSTGLSPDTIKLISTAIERVKTYPVLARKRGIEGTVHVSFRVREDGRPQEIEILKSSGFNILDNATVRVVKRAAPYPFMEKRVEVPVAYRLKNY